MYKLPTFLKLDFWRAIIAGELIALLSLPVLKNIKFLELPILQNNLYPFLVLWLLFLPLATVFGLYIFYRIALFRWSTLFQIGKFGIIGLLNTFLNAGIFNIFILITGIAIGWLVNIFVIISFLLTMIHSFFWNKWWIFEANNVHKTKEESFRFFIVSTSVALINTALMHVLINVIGAPGGIDPKIWDNISLAIITPFFFLGNFFGYKIFVFKK